MAVGEYNQVSWVEGTLSCVHGVWGTFGKIPYRVGGWLSGHRNHENSKSIKGTFRHRLSISTRVNPNTNLTFWFGIYFPKVSS